MPDFTRMKLGRKPFRYNAATPKFAKYMALMTTLPVAPATADWTTKITNLGMMLNDQLGDCVCADMGHQEQAWTAANGNQVIVPDSAVLSLYESVCGYEPGQPATDQGCVIDDVLSYMVKTGIGSYKIDGFADFSPSRTDLVQDAVAYFGGCTLGVELPLAWQTATEWDAPPAGTRPIGQWQPNSWGGHCVPVVKYDTTGVYVITWGSVMKMTWAAFAIYVDQCSVLISEQWANANGSPAGSLFPLTTLEADMTAFNAAPTPPVPPVVPPTPPTPPVPPNPPPGPFPPNPGPHHPPHHRGR